MSQKTFNKPELCYINDLRMGQGTSNVFPMMEDYLIYVQKKTAGKSFATASPQHQIVVGCPMNCKFSGSRDLDHQKPTT